MVKVELREFAEATRRMVQLSGVKKTRLMLRVRPTCSRKTFILKSSDGRTTLTTRVEHQGQLRIVEGIVNDYVGRCTAALVPAPSPAAAAVAEPAAPSLPGHGKQTTADPPAPAGKGQQQQPQQQQGGGGKKKKGGRR